MDASRLINILEQQSSAYQVLVDLSKKLQEAIVVNNIAKIDSLIKMQMTIVMKLSSLESRRSKVASEISQQVDVPKGELSIKEIKKYLGEVQFSELENLEKTLNDKISALSEINSTNKMLIKNGLDLIDYSLEVLGVTNDATYDKKGITNHKKIIDEKV